MTEHSADSSAMASDEDSTALLDLSEELLLLIAWQMEPRTLVRFGSCCRSLSKLVLKDEAYAWAAALEQAGGDPRHPEPRRALRCLTTLERVHWRRASSTRPGSAGPRPPARRHHATLACCGGETLIIVGGEHGRARWVHADAFAFDVRAGTWTQAAKATTWPDGDGPRRTFWDTEVGRVNRLVLVTDSAEREWALLYAERASEGAALSQPEETWLLGPLGPAAGAASWQWIRLGAAPTSRAVGYTVNALSHRPGLAAVVLGGLDVSERPLLALESLVIQATSDGGVDAHWGAHDVDVIAAGLASFQRPPEPPARAHHAAVEWPGRGLLVVGGEGRGGRNLRNDLWLLEPSGDSLHWRKLPFTLPNEAGRTQLCAAVVGGGPSTHRLVVFGGSCQPVDNMINSTARQAPLDFWARDLDGCETSSGGWDWLSWQRSRSPLPTEPRLRASAATVHAGGTMLVYGGSRLVGGWPADCDAVDTLAIRLGAPGRPPRVRTCDAVDDVDDAPAFCLATSRLRVRRGSWVALDDDEASPTAVATAAPDFELVPAPALGIALACRAEGDSMGVAALDFS